MVCAGGDICACRWLGSDADLAVALQFDVLVLQLSHPLREHARVAKCCSHLYRLQTTAPSSALCLPSVALLVLQCIDSGVVRVWQEFCAHGALFMNFMPEVQRLRVSRA